MSTDTHDAASSDGEGNSNSPPAERDASESAAVPSQPTARASQVPPAPSSAAAPFKTSPPPQAAEPASPPEPPADQKLAETQAEAGKLRDQLLRTAADFDNFRKRSRREQDDAFRRGREGLLKDLLPVFDNLERAAVHAEGAADAKAVSDGLRIVLKQFADTLERSDIKRIATVGRPFDPTVHEAIHHLASTDHPAGVILAEVQAGYTVGDHLVRAAMVVVSKGPPAEDPPTN